MSQVIQFSSARSKPRADTATRLRIQGLQHDESGPLLVTVPEFLAAGIRRSALWANKKPEQFVIDWLAGRQA